MYWDVKSSSSSRWLTHAFLGFAALALAGVLVSSVAAAPTQARPASSDLHSLLNTLTKQLRLAYRRDLPEYGRRIEQLSAAIRAWNASPQSQADHAKMTAWLRQSIHNSMPGLTQPLPPLPTFGAVARDNAPAQTVTAQKPVVAPEPSTADSLVAAKAVVKATDVHVKKPATPAKPNDDPADEDPFWKRHPAAKDLPAEFSDEDPFRDDPLFSKSGEN